MGFIMDNRIRRFTLICLLGIILTCVPRTLAAPSGDAEATTPCPETSSAAPVPSSDQSGGARSGVANDAEDDHDGDTHTYEVADEGPLPDADAQGGDRGFMSGGSKMFNMGSSLMPAAPSIPGFGSSPSKKSPAKSPAKPAPQYHPSPAQPVPHYPPSSPGVTVVETVYEENMPTTRLQITSGSPVRSRLVSQRVEPDGTQVQIFRKKVVTTPTGQDRDVDYDDPTPYAVVKTVKRKVHPNGQEVVQEFGSPNTKERVVSTLPASDGSDITIIKKKVRQLPNGVQYDVDYDDNSPGTVTKTIQKVTRVDGSVIITENFPHGVPPVQTTQPVTTIRKVQRRLPDGRIVEVEDHEVVYSANHVLIPNNPRVRVLKSATAKDGSQIVIYTIKVKRRPDGSEVETDQNDNSPGVREKTIRKITKPDGSVAITEGIEEPEEGELVGRIVKLIKKRPDGNVIEVTEGADEQYKDLPTVARIVRSRRRLPDGTEIDVEDDSGTAVRKEYRTKGSICVVTVYMSGQVVKRYQTDPSERPNDIDLEPIRANPGNQAGQSNFGGGVRDGLKGSLGLGTLAGDGISGLAGAPPISSQKNIADELMDGAIDGTGMIADIPGGMADQFGKQTGTSFLVEPAVYTGGFVLGAMGGGELIKGKIFYDAGKTAVNVAGLNDFVPGGTKTVDVPKKEGTSWFMP